MNLIISLLINSVAVFATGYLLPGINIQSFWTAILVAIVLGVLNTFLKPILSILALPITILTLGLFQLVINALIVLLVSAIIPGFGVENFWWALLFAIVLSIISSILNSVIKE
jgi:putative membrane protein